MGLYSQTLGELIDLSGFILFNPEVMSRYAMADAVEQKITQHFYNREIAYDTPQYFQLKLNEKLNVLSDNYNKMLQSQLIEIDPFVTEYLEVTGKEDRHRTGTTKESHLINKGNERLTSTQTDRKANEKYEATGTDTNEKSSVGTTVNGKLYSEANNESMDETVSRDLNRTENAEYEETKNGTKETTGNTTEANTSTDNQTGRQWTEKGSSDGHNLEVHSDTPQAMLFNEPNHYYGTGRAHDYGEVKTDSNGNQYYEHYPETEPSSIDTGSYSIGGGDTPWFNYASAADNKTGHDSYNKSGTETYSKSGSENKNKNSTENSEENVATNGTKDITTNETENTTTNREISATKNASENAKQDDTRKENYSGSTTDNHTQDNTSNTYSATDSKFNENATDNSHQSEKEHEITGDSRFKKGRTMQSPADLLSKYRGTLQYNADLWLFSELEPLFIGLF